jgi:hypothetical protein
MVSKNFHTVSLIPLNERAKKIVKYFDNKLLVQEYDSLGKPLNLAPNGKQGIFCVSPDLSWRGWFILDEDVRFEYEQTQIDDIIGKVGKQ